MGERGKKRVNSSKKFLFIFLLVFLIAGVVAPSLYYLYNSASEVVFMNRTEVSSFGLRPFAPLLFMDFNSPPESNTINPYGFTYVKDNSIFNNFGTKTDTHPWNPGKIGNGLGFDGSNDYAKSSNSNSLNFTGAAGGNYSYAVWHYPNQASDSDAQILSNDGGSGPSIMIRQEGTVFQWGIHNGVWNLLNGPVVIPNQWILLVGVYNGSAMNFYVNGVLYNSSIGAKIASSVGNNGVINIGGRVGASFTNGSIDEVMIFNKTLNQSEITNLYNNQSAGNQSYLATDSNLVSYYKLDELSGTTASDSKGANTGTLNGYVADTSPAWNSTGGYDGSGAYGFDGGDYIDYSSQVIPLGAKSISFWIKTSSTTDSMLLDNSLRTSTYHGTTIDLNLLHSGKIIFWSLKGTGGVFRFNLESNTSINNNIWHYVTCVWDGTTNANTVKIYIDGSLDNTMTATATETTTAAANLAVGSGADHTSKFNGTIDQIQIFNRSLSAAEVLCLYNGTGCGGKNNSNYIGKYANGGDFKSLIFFNPVSSLWNVNLSIADTNSPASGILNNKNEINLSNPNLISYWDLNGNYLDAKGRNNGTAFNGVNNATGISSGAIRFDGVNDYVNLSGFNLNGDASYTLSLWAYPVQYKNDVALVCFGQTGITSGSICLSQQVNGQNISMNHYGNDRAFSKTWNLNQWQHLVFNYNSSSSNETLYFNGQAIESWAPADLSLSSSRPTNFGRWVWAANYYNGSLDEILVYNTSLSALQVSQLYKSGLSQHANTNITVQTRTASGYNISDSSLVGMWGLNGYNFSDSKGTNSGLPQNGVKINKTGCKIGNCAQFDGVNDFINFSNGAVNITTSDLSFGLWVKPQSPASTNSMLIQKRKSGANYNGYAFYIQKTNAGCPNANGCLRIQISDGTLADAICYNYTSTPFDENWHYYSVTINRTSSTGVKCYIDGNQVGTSSDFTARTGSLVNTEPLAIGVSPQFNNDFFNGSMDEVAIYNRSLNATEISNLYNSGLGMHAPADNSLVSTWYFDEDEIIGTDLSNKNNQGGCSGAACPILNNSGIVGSAYSFDGSDDYVGISDSASMRIGGSGNSFAISSWIKLSRTSGTNFLFSSHGGGCETYGFASWFDTTYGIASQIRAGDNSCQVLYLTPYTQFPLNTWMHVVFQYNTTDLVTYIDGNQKGITHYVGYMKQSTIGMNIGRNINTGTNNLQGSIDEVRIYNRSLSASEISDLYNLGTTHINWNNGGNYSTEAVVTDGVGTSPQTTGKFMQYKTNFYTNDTNVVPYLLGHNITYTPAVININIAYPLSGYNYNTNVTAINLSVTASLGVSACWFSNNSGVNNYSVTAGCTSNFTNLFSIEGRNNWTVYANDTYGQLSSTSFSFVVDFHNPNATLNTPLNAIFANASSQNYTVNITDNLGVKNATLKIYNSTNSLVNTTVLNLNPGVTQSTIGIVVSLVDGFYSWFYNLFDWAGNNFATTNNTLTIDTLRPSLIINSPTNAFNSSNATLVVNFTVTDLNLTTCLSSKNGAANITRACVSGVAFTFSDTYNEGANTVTIYVNDSAGNKNSTTVIFYVDTIFPQISFSTGTEASDSNKSQSNIYVNISLNETNPKNITYSLYDSSRALIINSTLSFFNATGGNITYDGAYTVHTFTQNGTFSFAGSGNVEVLVVAGGGGGGGGGAPGGGGGAGGLVYSPNLLVAGVINVTVGVGGTEGNNGGASVFGLISASGGGRGSNWRTHVSAAIGGSGGGGGYQSAPGAAGLAGEGNAGGAGHGAVGQVEAGGGGGAGAVGETYTTGQSGNGGNGLNYSINGTNIYYAGGGGGTATDQGTLKGIGGLGGGGNGSNAGATAGIAGTNGTGGGGGGAHGGVGGTGGSGIVIIRYLTSSAAPTNINWTNLADGTYYYNVSTYDYAGNYNKTETRKITLDTTRPQISFTTGTEVNFANKSQSNIYVNISLNELNFKNITYSLHNSTFSNITTYLSNTSTDINWVNLTDGIYYYNVSTYDYAGNYNLTETRAITLDTHNPNVTLISPVDNYYTNNQTQNYTANLTDNLGIQNATLNIYNSTNNLVSSTIVNFVSGVTESTVGVVVTLADGLYSWFYNLFDWAGNNFATTNRTLTIDTLKPVITSVIYSPTSLNDLDPNVLVTVQANVADERTNISLVMIQYSNGTDFFNKTMTSLNLGGLYDTYSVNFTTQATEANYSFNVWANDTSNNFQQSPDFRINSSWDCTWTATSDLGAMAGFNINKEVGRLIITNTGDYNSSDDHCLLYFGIKHNLEGKKLYLDNRDGSTIRPYGPLATGQILNISINYSFGEVVKQEQYLLAINDTYLTSSVSSIQSLGIAVTNLDGPYLYQSITSYPSSVYIKPQVVNLDAYISNLMGSDASIMNNTAFNVSSNWVIDSAFTNLTGNISSSFANISDSEQHSLNLGLNATNWESLTQGIYSFTLNSQGMDYNATLIRDTNNNSNFTSSVNITFLCYPLLDGFEANGCWPTDPDTVYCGNGHIDANETCSTCSADAGECSTTTGDGGSGGGGGGGGGATSGSIAEKSVATYELLRGEKQEFTFRIENKYADPMTNVVISVTGINAEYISISPSTIPFIAGKSYKDITVKINAPAYFTGKKYTLIFDILSKIITNATTFERDEKKAVTLYILEVSRDVAVLSVNESMTLLDEMLALNISTKEIADLIKQESNAYSEISFSDVKTLHEKIKLIYQNAIESKSILEELTSGVASAEKDGITVTETRKMLYLAQIAFNRGDYALALERLQQAKLVYALEVKGEFNLLYAIKNNPAQTAGITLIAGFVGITSTLFIRYRLLKKKLRMLIEEEALLLELMKMVQRQCFSENRMSMEEYEQAMSQYESKLSETVEDKIRTETKITNILKIKGKKMALDEEKKRLLRLIMGIQDDYLNKNKIETRIYENMLKSYSGRLTEVDEQLAFMEAQEALKKEMSIRKMFKM